MRSDLDDLLFVFFLFLIIALFFIKTHEYPQTRLRPPPDGPRRYGS